jgi:hypothetical protein
VRMERGMGIEREAAEPVKDHSDSR